MFVQCYDHVPFSLKGKYIRRSCDNSARHIVGPCKSVVLSVRRVFFRLITSITEKCPCTCAISPLQHFGKTCHIISEHFMIMLTKWEGILSPCPHQPLLFMCFPLFIASSYLCYWLVWSFFFTLLTSFLRLQHLIIWLQDHDYRV